MSVTNTPSAGVYAITCTLTGKQYVGSAVNIRKRWKAHRHTLATKGKSPPKLQRAWDKYGPDVFTFSVLLHCAPVDTLLYEQIAIDALSPAFNTRKVASSNLGVRWSEQTNAKKSARHKIHMVAGVVDSVAGHARRFAQISPRVASLRISRGWTVSDAVTRPPEAKQVTGARAAATHARNHTHPTAIPKEAFGKLALLTDLVQEFSTAKYTTVRARIRRGWDIERALTTP